jgi:hypothetical protein
LFFAVVPGDDQSLQTTVTPAGKRAHHTHPIDPRNPTAIKPCAVRQSNTVCLCAERLFLIRLAYPRLGAIT